MPDPLPVSDVTVEWPPLPANLDMAKIAAEIEEEIRREFFHGLVPAAEPTTLTAADVRRFETLWRQREGKTARQNRALAEIMNRWAREIQAVAAQGLLKFDLSS